MPQIGCGRDDVAGTCGDVPGRRTDQRDDVLPHGVVTGRPGDPGAQIGAQRKGGVPVAGQPQRHHQHAVGEQRPVGELRLAGHLILGDLHVGSCALEVADSRRNRWHIRMRICKVSSRDPNSREWAMACS